MMPFLALIGIPGPRWLPPLPLPLFLLWPVVLIGLGIAKLLDRGKTDGPGKFLLATRLFCELRGLAIDVDKVNQKPVRIRFI